MVLLQRFKRRRIVPLGIEPSPGVSITVLSVPLTYKLTITANPTVGYVGDYFSFSGFLNQNGQPIPNISVRLWRNGTYTGAATRTSSDGSYVIRWRATVAGKFNFHAEAATP